MKKKHWYDYLWVYAIVYFALGFFNILFAWLGMIDFLLPLILAIFGGNKFFCNHLCGRGQLFSKLGTDLKCSRCKPTPRWIKGGTPCCQKNWLPWTGRNASPAAYVKIPAR